MGKTSEGAVRKQTARGDPAKRRKGSTSPTAEKPPLVAQMVSGEGTDDEIRQRCADSVAGWDDLSERARADLVRLMRDMWQQPFPPRMEVADSGGVRPAGNPTLAALRTVETFASGSSDYADHRVNDLARYHGKAGVHSDAPGTAQAISADLAFIHGAKPSDTVQSTLLLQMASVHHAAEQALRLSMGSQYLDHAQVMGNLAAKLFNVWTRQAEVLAKLQRGGEQIVKHIHLDNRGGQAIVADQVVTGGSNGNRGGQAYEQGAVSAAMFGSDSVGRGVPMPCDAGEAALLPAWGRSGFGGADGESECLEAREPFTGGSRGKGDDAQTASRG